MNFVLDLIVLGIIILTVFLSARKGFVRTLVDAVGFIAALVIAFTLGGTLAEFTFDKAIQPSVVSVVTESTQENADNLLEATWNALPKFVVNNSDSLGLSKDKLQNNLDDFASESAVSAVETAMETTVRPLVVKVLGLVYTAIIFFVLSFAVHLISKLLNKMFSFSIIGKLNKTLGGVIGAVKGVVFALVFCIVISAIMSFTGDFLIFTEEAVSSSSLFKLLSSLSPF